MSLSIGIVGLPNVGKSTLFNALTNLGVEAANYPFATIEPNVGIVPVPDERLGKLAKIENSAEVIPAVIEFKDIAGLVAGAHKGEGLGNQFLSHIREVDAIVEVVRLFDDPKITHVAGEVDPKRDIDTIETELILADLQLVEKKLRSLKNAAKGRDKDELTRLGIAEKYFQALSEGQLGSTVFLTDEQKQFLHEFPLLTNKPIMYVANVSSEDTAPAVVAGKSAIGLDLKLESELSQLSDEERKVYIKDLGLKMTGLEKLIQAGYELLGLITFFTAGPKETRAWTCPTDTRAPQAAGVIHTDFERGFIKAEVINWEKLVNENGWVKAREKGLIRTEGKEYVFQDGDVTIFKFNV